MVKVIITEHLFREIEKRFDKSEANLVIDKLETVEESPHKGKTVGNVGGIIIKELKYKKYRFYFITDGHVLKFGTNDEIASLLIKFVEMSGKKDQAKTIAEIERILKSLGFEGF